MLLQAGTLDVDLADVGQAFKTVIDIDEETKIRHVDYASAYRVAGAVAIEETIPLVGQEFLDRQRDPLIVDVDVGDTGLDVIASVQHFIRVLDPFRPAHVGDMNKAVNLIGDLHEGPELCQVADFAFDHAVNRM